MRRQAALDCLPGLSRYARELLQWPHAAATAPVRADLFGVQRFAQHGHSLAQAQAVVAPGSAPRGNTFFPRVEAKLAFLRTAFDYITLTSQSGHYISPAAEWLLDNFHLVEAQLQQIREGVPRRYYAQLPKLSAPPLAGLPRVYGIAWAYVAHTDSVLETTLFTAFLEAYQDVDELSTGELWALPTTLRVVLLENLRRVAGLRASYLTQPWQRLPVERGADPPAEDVMRMGPDAVIARAMQVVGDGPVYETFDVNDIDPGFAPGTGTPEVGGLTPREVLAILRGLRGCHIIGADVVEVAPQYDATTNTAQVGAQVLFLELYLVAKALGKAPR